MKKEDIYILSYGAEKLKTYLSTFTNIDLSHNNIGDEGARTLANGLAGNTTITTIDLGWSDIGYKGAIALADTIASNTTITTIDLRGNNIDDESVKAFADALITKKSFREVRSAHVTEMLLKDLRNRNIPFFRKKGAGNTNITTINFSSNDIGAEGANALAGALARNATITTINLSNNNIGDQGARALADKLSSNTTITTINLRGNYISAEGGRALAETLASNTTITTINLYNNHIGAKGAKALAATLADNTTITRFDLGSNNIGDEGARALADALAGNTAITTIDLSRNGIGAEGARALADALASNATVVTIDLSSNKFGAEGRIALREKGFSPIPIPINLGAVLYIGNDIKGGGGSDEYSDLYHCTKNWGRKRDETSGRLPLFTAAARSLTWVDTRQIFAANMPAINDVDGLTGLPVFMLAAVGPRSNIESIYNLLIEYPSAIGLVSSRHHCNKEGVG